MALIDEILVHKVLEFLQFIIYTLFLYFKILRWMTTRVIGEHFGNLFEIVSDEVSQLQAVNYVGYIAALCCAVPILLFVVFGITSIIITFGGFLLIEGVLLAFGGLCMVACILALILVISAFAVTLGVSYVLVLKLICAMKNFEPTSSSLRAIASSIENENVASNACKSYIKDS